MLPSIEFEFDHLWVDSPALLVLPERVSDNHWLLYRLGGQEAISLHRDIIIIGRCVISVTSL